MFYKPNYCCNCGEKIERIEWYFWTNRRFCEVCETDFQLDDWIKRIFPTLFLFFGIFGIGSYFLGVNESLDLKNSDLKSNSQSFREARNLKPKTLENSRFENETDAEKTADKQSFETKRTSKQKNETGSQKITSDREERRGVIVKSPQNVPKESVYFCGAKTKKGTACSRRVKGGGRCWQHEGRTAILSENELKVDK